MAKKRPRRKVYIGGREARSLREAARELGLPLASLHRKLKASCGEFWIGGERVSDSPPPEHRGAAPQRAPGPLLRYGRGEAPADRGLPEQWR